MPKISGLPKARPYVDENLVFNSEGRVAQEEIESRIAITGVGAPEGNVFAEVGAIYYDLEGGTGAIIYIKCTAEGVDGWVLA